MPVATLTERMTLVLEQLRRARINDDMSVEFVLTELLDKLIERWAADNRKDHP